MVDRSALSPAAIERLGALAVDLFEARAFADAKDALELLLHTCALSIPLSFTYAVCLTELGHDAEAREISATAERSIGALAAGDPRREILETLALAMTPWVAGGAQSRSMRDGLKSSAEKWLPRLGR